MSDALTKLGEAARRAREYISPWAYFSPSDVASNLPGGGIPAAVEPYKQGLQKTAEATKAFREGRWGDAARWYGSGMLDTATAGLSALPEGGAMAKLAMAAAPAIKAAVGASEAGADGAGAMQKLSGIRAFHGSPHDFDKFDMSKIGTGEGAQAYGHGLYFAENEDVARGYRNALAPGMGDGALRAAGIGDADVRSLRQFTQSAVDPDVAMRDWLAWTGKKETPELRQAFMQEWQGRNPGKMYEVRINADPEHFLDWDKPLSEQSEAVRRALGGVGGRSYSDAEFKAQFGNVLAGTPYESMSARNVLEPVLSGGKDSEDFINLVRHSHPEAADRLQQAVASYGSPTGSQVYKSMGHTSRSTTDIVPSFDRGSEASQALREAGIPGIKYLDAGSRGAGDGTRNYVVFDDKLVEIIRKYGWMPGMAIPAAMALEMQQAQEQSAPQM